MAERLATRKQAGAIMSGSLDSEQWQTKVNTTGMSDSTGSCTEGECGGIEGTEQGSSEPPEPSPEPIVKGRGCGVEVSTRVTRGTEIDAICLWLRDQMARIAAETGVEGGNISIAIVDDAVMTTLHHDHLGSEAPTDVLTFDLRGADSPGDAIDVDVAVNLDEARRRAALRGHDPQLELLLYAVHGVLHVTGHDDHDAEAALRMHRREDALIQAIGLPPVYGETADGGAVASARRGRPSS